MNLQPQEIKPALRECLSFQLASTNKDDLGNDENYIDAINRSMQTIPQVKYIEQANYLKSVLLPEIEKTRGKNHSHYQYFLKVFESLLYSIKIVDNDQTFRRLLSQEKIYNEFLQKRVLFLEKELLRYTTLDELSTKELTAELFKRNPDNK